MLTQAWQFKEKGEPAVLSLETHALPPPGPGEALVRLHAIGVNRSDLNYLAGKHRYEPPVPSFLGQEAAGEIVELGLSREGIEPPAGFRAEIGARVGLLVGRVDLARMGAFRELGLYPTSALLPLPAAYSWAEGAAFWLTALTAWGSFERAGMNPQNAPRKTVLITAASSGIGTMALQLARLWGAQTIAVTTSPGKVERLRPLADLVIAAEQPEHIVKPIMEFTEGKGFDIVLDSVGAAYVAAFYQCAAQNAEIVHIGRMAGDAAPLDLQVIGRKELNIHGYTVYNLQKNPLLLDRAIYELQAMARTRMRSGEDFRPIIAHEYPFALAPKALEKMSRNEHVGKIVLIID